MDVSVFSKDQADFPKWLHHQASESAGSCEMPTTDGQAVKYSAMFLKYKSGSRIKDRGSRKDIFSAEIVAENEPSGVEILIISAILMMML